MYMAVVGILPGPPEVVRYVAAGAMLGVSLPVSWFASLYETV